MGICYSHLETIYKLRAAKLLMYFSKNLVAGNTGENKRTLSSLYLHLSWTKWVTYTLCTQKSPWSCVSTVHQQLKCPCVVNTVLDTNPKHSPIQATMKNINSLAAITSTMIQPGLKSSRVFWKSPLAAAEKAACLNCACPRWWTVKKQLLCPGSC